MKNFAFPLSILFIGLFSSIDVIAKTVTVSSPDNKITISVNDDNQPSYQVNFNDETIITPSKLGMLFKNSHGFSDGFKITSVSNNQVDSSWQLPWGERKNVADKHNELLLTFTTSRDSANEYKVRFRAFNDGIGFRYEVPKQKGLNDTVEITNELTEFSLKNAKQSTAWWIPARGWNRYEFLYNTTNVESVDRAHTPFTFKLPSGTHISIHEAALVDYAAMTLNQKRPGTLKADLTPWSDGSLVKTSANFKSPWRTIQISKDAVGLLNSNLILNLNEPNKLGDVSWVEPGKYVGIWWGMHIETLSLIHI